MVNRGPKGQPRIQKGERNMPPRTNRETEKVTITLPCDLIQRVDELAQETNMSRSGLMADMIGKGLQQLETTRKLFANRFVLRMFQKLFGIKLTDCEKEAQETRCASAANEALRRKILKDMAKLSMAEAEAEINRDMGLDELGLDEA